MNPAPPSTRDVWERIAAFWDGQVGEGNDFQKTLIMPATDRLLNPQPRQAILDIACGNGNYSRMLARKGAHVTACDICQTFLELARARTTAGDGTIDYLRIDATDRAELLSLGESRFDSAVCSMAMMDMPAIEPMLEILPCLLKPGGCFVFSLPHPCFNSNSFKLTADLVVERERVEQVFGIQVFRYLSPDAGMSVGIINQPEPHPFFHRPLSQIFAACFSAGWVIDGLEEPAYPKENSKGKNVFLSPSALKSRLLS